MKIQQLFYTLWTRGTRKQQERKKFSFLKCTTKSKCYQRKNLVFTFSFWFQFIQWTQQILVEGRNFCRTWLSGKLSYESKIMHMLEILGFRLVGNRKIAVTTNLTWLTQALGLEIINLMQKTTNKKDLIIAILARQRGKHRLIIMRSS